MEQTQIEAQSSQQQEKNPIFFTGVGIQHDKNSFQITQQLNVNEDPYMLLNFKTNDQYNAQEYLQSNQGSDDKLQMQIITQQMQSLSTQEETLQTSPSQNMRSSEKSVSLFEEDNTNHVMNQQQPLLDLEDKYLDSQHEKYKSNNVQIQDQLYMQNQTDLDQRVKQETDFNDQEQKSLINQNDDQIAQASQSFEMTDQIQEEEIQFDLDKSNQDEENTNQNMQDQSKSSFVNNLNYYRQNSTNKSSYNGSHLSNYLVGRSPSLILPRDEASIQKDIEQLEQEKEEESKSNLEIVTLQDFHIIEQIGKGAYGRVFVAEHKEKMFAVKELSKEFIISLGKTDSVFRERDILKKLDHPAITKLYYTFQDEDNLYFVMEHIPYGSLQELMESYQQKGNQMSLQLVRFYAAWLILALEHIHSHSIVHRDLKPQNILVDSQHYLKLIDFGDSKEIKEEEMFDQRTYSAGRMSAGSFSTLIKQSEKDKVREPTFVGTPLYVAPEMLDHNLAGTFTDLWALGCIIYQMLCDNKTPFHGKSYDEVFNNILERRLRFPKTLDPQAKDLIDKLLDFEPTQRLGFKNYEQIKNHPFFNGIDFQKLKEKVLEVPDFQKFHEENNEVLLTEEQHNPYLVEETDFEMVERDKVSSYLKVSQFFGPIDLNMKVMDGLVKLRRNLIFFKTRTMILLEDGRIILAKDREVKHVFQMDRTTEITLQKKDRFQLKSKHFHEVVDSQDAEVWVNILASIKSLTVQNRQSSKNGKVLRDTDIKKKKK